MGRSLPQLCSDQPHATFTLRQTESALHFHTLALIPIVLSLVSGFTLLRPPQSWAGKTDPMRLAIAESCSHLVLSCLLWSVAAVLETAKTLVLQRISDAPTGIDQLHIRKTRVQIEMESAPKRSIFLRAGKKIRKKKTLVRYGFADSSPG